jgi:uncharacterized phage-associated protein
MKISLPKLKAVLLYFCENTDLRFLGKVKLMKLFYYLDFIHVKKFASPVTYDRYVKLDHGPIPSTIKNMVDDLECDPDSSVLADVIDVVHSDGQNIHRVNPKRKMTDADRKLFSVNEVKVLEEVCSRFGDKNTRFIEEASHKEAAWNSVAMLQETPYTLAVKDNDCLVAEEDIRLSLVLAGL